MTAIVITMFVLVYVTGSLLALKGKTKKPKPRYYWEAPPFPLDNSDRISNWHRRRWRM